MRNRERLVIGYDALTVPENLVSLAASTMALRRFTIGQLMIAVAAVAIEFGLLPIPFAIVAACLTLTIPLVADRTQWGIVAIVFTVLMALVIPATVRTNCGGSRTMECASNLRQVSLALQQYRIDNGCYPPAIVTDSQGKPLYSWRVLVLPWVDRGDLYNAFNFRQPWNGPDNLAISTTRIKLFTCPSDARVGPHTNFLAVTGPGTAFTTGGTSTGSGAIHASPTTIVLAETNGLNVSWAEPRDLDIATLSRQINDPTRPSIRSGGHRGVNITAVDCTSRRLDENLAPKTFNAMLKLKASPGAGNPSRLVK